MVPSIRSCRVVSNGGLHLSVAHIKPCFKTLFACFNMFVQKVFLQRGLKCMHAAVDGTINQISSSRVE